MLKMDPLLQFIILSLLIGNIIVCIYYGVIWYYQNLKSEPKSLISEQYYPCGDKYSSDSYNIFSISEEVV
jgi:hypothetical protein